MKIYLAGPMSGYEENNHSTFFRAEDIVKSLTGGDVLNPARHFDSRTNLPRKVYLKKAIETVLEADEVALLPDWDLSDGAVLEFNVARALELPISELIETAPDEWELLPVAP